MSYLRVLQLLHVPLAHSEHLGLLKYIEINGLGQSNEQRVRRLRDLKQVE